jgi:hypothetical protein
METEPNEVFTDSYANCSLNISIQFARKCVDLGFKRCIVDFDAGCGVIRPGHWITLKRPP